jgi:putative hemolysin
MYNLRLALLIPVLLAVAGCAGTPANWAASESDRELAIVRVSYEYAKATDPRLDDAQAAELAQNRCATWGYELAEVIPGNLRNCSVKTGERCELWKVTREFQCREGTSFASRLSR